MQLWPKRPTDEQFIERVRKAERIRKWYSVILLTGGICWLVMVVFMYRSLWPFIDGVRQNVIDHGRPSEAEWLAWACEMRFATGVIFGLFVGTGWLFGTWLVSLSWTYFVRDRRSRLLLQCWDQLHPKNGAANSDAENP